MHGLNQTSKRKHCMITNTNTATITTCDVKRENTTSKHDQRCSAWRGLFNLVKYIVCIIYSIHIRNSIITWCKSAHSIFQTRKTLLIQRQLIASDKRST